MAISIKSIVIKYYFPIWIFIGFSTILESQLAAQILTNNGQTIWFETGSQSTIDGDILNQSGTITINSDEPNFATLNIYGNLTNNDEISAPGLINISGNWINNASFEAEEGTINMNGINQIIGGSNETTFFNLDFVINGIKSLESNIHIDGIIDLGDSELNTGSNAAFIDNNNINAVQFINGFVSSDEDGYLQRSMLFAGQYIFPVGENFESPFVRQIVISPSFAEISKFNCRFVLDDPDNNGMYSTLLEDSIEYINEDWFHFIEREAGTNPVKLEIYHLEDDGNFNKFANWKITPQPAWYYSRESYKSSDISWLTITENTFNDFSNPAFILCYKTIPEVDTTPEVEDLIIYNSFSPNGDNLNDDWVVENCPNCKVTIYNRNGNIVFESLENDVNWDGKFKDQKVPDATYYYVIENPSDSKIYKGSVTIIR
ncbi:MAG: gliding motility-associated C-terminal domain-containing protein [Bacteroidales bacterium]|nr:gliding motility-associated C-terminal domain-containing protein [Bacteroidales bacterium]